MAWKPFNHLGLKVAALALGTLLWFMVSGHQIVRRIPVSVSYSNVPQPLQMTGDQIDDVSVNVRGGDNLVSSLGQGDLRVVVDLNDAHTGTNLLPLRIDQVIAPLGVEVMQVDPPTVTVTLERSGSATWRVVPEIEGVPAAGFVVGRITVEPATATVVGPESRLKTPLAVVTERVSIAGRTTSISQDVSVGVADAQLRVRNPRTVRVTVQIVPGPESGRSQ
ncbi:MAG: CdaR family protein [Acidobacteriota bacterium]